MGGGGGVKLLKMYPGRGDQCWMVGLEQQWGAVAEDSENIWSGTFGSSRRRSEIMEGKETLLGQLLRQLEKEGFEINGTWNSTLKFSSATQEQALRTNYRVDKSVECAT